MGHSPQKPSVQKPDAHTKLVEQATALANLAEHVRPVAPAKQNMPVGHSRSMLAMLHEEQKPLVQERPVAHITVASQAVPWTNLVIHMLPLAVPAQYCVDSSHPVEDPVGPHSITWHLPLAHKLEVHCPLSSHATPVPSLAVQTLPVLWDWQYWSLLQPAELKIVRQKFRIQTPAVEQVSEEHW